MVALKPLQLFLFGLLCTAIGGLLGLIKLRKVDVKHNTESKELIKTVGEGEVIMNASSKQLRDHWKENKDKFETSSVSNIAKMTGRSERAVKTFITRNKLFCADYGDSEPTQ
jgi:hypothetical protein